MKLLENIFTAHECIFEKQKTANNRRLNQQTKTDFFRSESYNLKNKKKIVQSFVISEIDIKNIMDTHSIYYTI